MKKEQLVLDTSLFVNPDSARAYGKTPTDALRRFLEIVDDSANVELLMPPSVYRELMYFVEEKKINKRLLMKLKKQAPTKHEIQIPGIFLYELVENMRDRVDRGLRLAERHAREALEKPSFKSNGPVPKGTIRPDAEMIGRLRESYRRIMREGMLDSRADVDHILLCYEYKALLVSADQGVMDWAENLGIQILSHEHLLDYITDRVA